MVVLSGYITGYPILVSAYTFSSPPIYEVNFTNMTLNWSGTNGINGTDGIDGIDGINGSDGIDGINGSEGIVNYSTVLSYNGSNYSSNLSKYYQSNSDHLNTFSYYPGAIDFRTTSLATNRLFRMYLSNNYAQLGTYTADGSNGSYVLASANTVEFIYTGVSGRREFFLKDAGIFGDLDTGTGDSAVCYSSSTTEIFYNSGLTTCLASTEKYKTNLTNITSSKTSNFMKLQPISYEYNNVSNIGFSAESVAKIYPELVGYDERGNISGVKYENMVALLTQVLQEQELRIQALEAKK